MPPLVSKRLFFSLIKERGNISGLTIIFKIYNFSGSLEVQNTGIEIGNLGIYYVDFQLSPHKEYICIAEEVGGRWKDAKYIPSGK